MSLRPQILNMLNRHSIAELHTQPVNKSSACFRVSETPCVPCPAFWTLVGELGKYVFQQVGWSLVCGLGIWEQSALLVTFYKSVYSFNFVVHFFLVSRQFSGNVIPLTGRMWQDCRTELRATAAACTRSLPSASQCGGGRDSQAPTISWPVNGAWW